MLLRLWPYDFYDMTLFTEKPATSYDKTRFLFVGYMFRTGIRDAPWPSIKKLSVMVSRIAGSNTGSASRLVENSFSPEVNGYLFRIREG